MDNLLRRAEGMRVYLPPVDAARLKYLAAFVMLIDHAAYAFLERASCGEGIPLMRMSPALGILDRILRAVGRQAFPVFCFFLVEGFTHTRSRIRYMARLAVFAAVSQLPFQLCLFPHSDVFHANVIFTLGIGFLAVWILEALGLVFLDRAPGSPRKGRKAKEEAGTAEGDAAGAEEGDVAGTAERDAVWAEEGDAAQKLVRTTLFVLAGGGGVYGLARLADLLHSDYSFGGVILIVLLYLLRNYRIPDLFISWAWLSWYNSFEIYSAPVFLMLAGYNGRRGKQHKYFFYIFYPAHLLILWLVRRYFFGI